MLHTSFFKKYRLLAILVCVQGGLSAQTPADEPPCLFDALYPPGTLQAAEARIGAALSQMKVVGASENSNDIRIIPVVVHVIHNDGSENIRHGVGPKEGFLMKH